MIALYQLGILGKDLPKLYGCHIFMTLSAQGKGIVIFPNGLINGIQLVGICLKTIDIFISNISGRLQVLADDLLT